MFGLMIRRIPKEITKLPKFVRRSDYWNKKIWAVELGVIDIGKGKCYGDLWTMFTEAASSKALNGNDTYYNITEPKKLLKLCKVFRWQNVIWAAYLLKKYDCEVYVYETPI